MKALIALNSATEKRVRDGGRIIVVSTSAKQAANFNVANSSVRQWKLVKNPVTRVT